MVCIHSYYFFTEADSTLSLLQGSTPQKLLTNFISVFGTADLVCFADNISATTMAWLYDTIPEAQVKKTSFGCQLSAFKYMLQLLYNDDRTNKDCIVYFIDGHVLHSQLSSVCIREGIRLADYITLIDSPDKYINSGQVLNQTVGGSLIWGNGEWTRVMFTAHSHWKFTYCASLSVAARMSTLLADRNVFDAIGDADRVPLFEKMWIGLQRAKSRTLISSIPGKASMTYTSYVSPTIDWSHLLV